MVDGINGASYQKFVTIEALVEYLHANKTAKITQLDER
jgi:Tfp pilus assembly pilus retraction ATPase PilT